MNTMMINNRNKLITPSVLIVLVFLLIACNKNTGSILKTADEVVRNYPDSALTLLSQIENPARLENQEKADYWRIHSLAHNPKSDPIVMDSLILYSLHFYQSNQQTNHLLETYALAGDYYGWKNQPDSAISLYNRGFTLAKNLKDTARISEFLSKAGMIEFHRGRHKEAVEYFKTRIHYDPKNHESYYLASFSPEQINDSIQYYIDEAVRLALQQKTNTDTLYAAHYLRNYADALVVKKDYDKAIELIKRTGELAAYYKHFEANDIMMTRIYINKGQLDSAQFYLDKAKTEHGQSFMGTPNEYNLISDINTESLFQAIIDTKRNRDASNTYYLMDHFNDSIIHAIVVNFQAEQKKTIEQNNMEKKNMRLFISKQRFQMILITTLFFIMLASIAVYLYILKRKSKLKEVEERVDSLQQLFREALNIKDEKATNNQLFRKTLLQQLGTIRLIATTPTKQNQQLLSQIIDISKEAVSTESLLKWDDLYAIIDFVYDKFYTKLIRKYGDVLIEKEIQLCCLLCANFSTAEISAVMQQHTHTIYQRKSTIRGKIHMGDKEDIIAFLEEQFNA